MIRAKWIVPVDQPPIENGSISIDGDKIVSIGPYTNTGAIDWGDVIVFPQYINAHTHLEFSHLRQPLKTPESFASWLTAVIAMRREQDPATIAEHLTESVQQGLTESKSAGSAAVGEIRIAPWNAADYRDPNILTVAFHERLGLNPSLVSNTVEDLERLIQSEPSNPSIALGLSPHAPYSTHNDLVKAMADLARRHRLPIAMHLAESREELDLLKTGQGPLRKLLDDLGVWHAAAIQPGTTILDYLNLLSLAPRSLVVHGNYLTSDEMDFIANRRERMSVAFCPRTHAYFQNEPYPLNELLRRGIEVSIATDSRATNPDLDVSRDLVYAAKSFPEIPAEQWLRMVTLNPARAIGLENRLGSLAVGKDARLAALPIPYNASTDATPEEIWLQALRDGYRLSSSGLVFNRSMR